MILVREKQTAIDPNLGLGRVVVRWSGCKRALLTDKC